MSAEKRENRHKLPTDPPWSWRPFRRLAEAQILHAVGDGMVAVALANTLFFAVPLGEAREKVALYLALTMAPFAVLSPLVGPWLDRRTGAYRTAIVIAAGGRAALAVMLVTRTERLTLYPLAFGLLVLSRVHGVSRSALLPDALPPRMQPMWGNAWLAVLSVVGGALGAQCGRSRERDSRTTCGAVGRRIHLRLRGAPGARLPRGETADVKRSKTTNYRALLSPACWQEEWRWRPVGRQWGFSPS